ncbi:DUF4232 domain-containing protein [Parafrankia elaeagni]|uniref:DUF4232 domain-containing protein n=1 Tax=Parafrankia elaeagni TaxID=222534 RepID=UPI000558514D|nr:DUF4232 domain-containing protein [Parafrankia elaeagni]
MRTTRSRSGPLLLAAATSLAVLLTGCGGEDAADQAVEPAPVTAGASAPSRPAAGGPATTEVTDVKDGPPTCAASGLTAVVADLEGAAGHVYGHLVLTNSGSTPCTITGYPGVSVVDDAGRQIGAPADRTGPAGEPVTLAPGGRATATLAITQPGLLPGCESTDQTVRGTSLRVYPPDDRASVLAPVADGVRTCRDPAVHQLTVTTFSAA